MASIGEQLSQGINNLGELIVMPTVLTLEAARSLHRVIKAAPAAIEAIPAMQQEMRQLRQDISAVQTLPEINETLKGFENNLLDEVGGMRAQMEVLPDSIGDKVGTTLRNNMSGLLGKFIMGHEPTPPPRHNGDSAPML